MAQNFINPVALGNLYVQNGINNPVGHDDVIAIRINSGPWGIGDRWSRVRVLLQDPQGAPLPQAEYDYEPGPVDLVGDYLLEGAFNVINQAFPNIQPLEGVHRYGPLHDGAIQVGDGFEMGFLPITQQEANAINGVGDLRRELAVLREIIRRQRLLGGMAPVNVVGPMPQQGQIIPVNHLRAVAGPTPTNPKEIALWLGKAVPGLEGIFPINNPAMRARVTNALIGSHPNLAVTAAEAQTWDQVIGFIYQRAHGAAAIHELPNILRDINRTEGVLVAYRLGMMFSGRNFNLVWGIVRQMLPGQALVANAQQQLDNMLDDNQRAQQLPEVLRGLYQLLGLDPLGRSQRPNERRQTESNQSTRRVTANNANRGRGRGRGSSRAPVPANAPVISDDRRNERREEYTPRYNLRPQPRQPDWYGRGRGQRNPYRAPHSDTTSSPTVSPQAEGGNRSTHSSVDTAGVRGRGRGRGGSSRAAVNVIHVTPSSTTVSSSSSNNDSSSVPDGRVGSS